LPPTRPGRRMPTYNQEQWQGDFDGQAIRLLITCRREGYDPWPLLKEVFVGDAGGEAGKQARQIDVSACSIDGARAQVLPPDKGELVQVVVVTNGSNRPIREATCKIEAIQAGPSVRHDKLADVYGELMPFALGSTARAEAFVLGERASTMPVDGRPSAVRVDPHVAGRSFQIMQKEERPADTPDASGKSQPGVGSKMGPNTSASKNIWVKLPGVHRLVGDLLVFPILAMLLADTPCSIALGAVAKGICNRSAAMAHWTNVKIPMTSSTRGHLGRAYH
jgi:hypothetical protein